MRILLVHGWGFGPGIFDPLAGALSERLPAAEISRLDLGFLEGEDGDLGPEDDWPRDCVAIGHSLGVLWLLQERPESFGALVSLQGFDCFACHVEEKRILSMQKSLKRDPYGLMTMFWRSCGSDPVAPAEALDQARLEQGLDWLMRWDASAARQAFKGPVLALASKDDPIVPEKMSRTIWKEDLLWSEPAGHLLPVRHPAWCAEKITEFIDDIGA